MRWLFPTILFSIFCVGQLFAQSEPHVRWNTRSEEVDASTWRLVFEAELEEGWHLYSQKLPKWGPLPTKVFFEKDGSYRLKGKTVEEGKRIVHFDDTFRVDVTWYEQSVVFSQLAKVSGEATVVGRVEYQVCSDEMCVPGFFNFRLPIGSKK